MERSEDHYAVEQFKTAKALEKRINERFEDAVRPFYLYMLTEGPKGLTAVFAEARVKK